MHGTRTKKAQLFATQRSSVDPVCGWRGIVYDGRKEGRNDLPPKFLPASEVVTEGDKRRLAGRKEGRKE